MNVEHNNKFFIILFTDSQQNSPMFLRPSLLPSPSSFNFDLGVKKPDTPRPSSKTFCLNPSRLSLNTPVTTRKLNNFFFFLLKVIVEI